MESIRTGGFIQLARHVPTGPTSPRQSIALWALFTIPIEAINRELQRVATGATAAPTDTYHSTAYPGGGSSEKIMAVASTIFPPARSAKRDENQAIGPKDSVKSQDVDSCIAVADPCVVGSSAHSREAETDCFLACAAQKKREDVGGEHATMHAVALI